MIYYLMNKKLSLLPGRALLATAIMMMAAGCLADQPQSASNSVATATAAPAAVAPVANTPPAVPAVVRIKAGASAPWTDSKGNVWAADQGFSGGETAERPDVTITNTPEQGIYRAEHYSMDSFSTPLANGKYLVKLHFAETYEGIEGPGQRVFSFKVQGHEFKDFDVWVKAGGPFKAYVETVPVEITDGKLMITFTSNVENPEINGIEIIPQP
jgi:hypothetical protein